MTSSPKILTKGVTNITSKLSGHMSIKKKIEQLEEKYGFSTPETASEANDPDQAQLPLWTDPYRAAPNEILRSALFSVRNPRSKREHYEDHPLALIGNGSITYTGLELRQDDQDTWLALLHLAREQPLGECIEFTPYQIKKLLGWSRSSIYTERLRKTLQRLQATTLTVRIDRIAKAGKPKGATISLVRKFDWQDDNGERLDRWRVWLEPEIRVLFGDIHYTLLEWKTRRRLQGSLSRWLHGFYASHKHPYPVKVETLRTASGARTRELKKFRQLLREALNELVKREFLESYEIDASDCVHVQRRFRPLTAAGDSR